MILKGKDFKYAIPFGPFLSMGAVIALFYGENLIRWYLYWNRYSYGGMVRVAKTFRH
jgi:leader peptidase (prepilin peptidase)/N-methyltransferase